MDDLLHFTKQGNCTSEKGSDMSKLTHLVAGSQGDHCDSRNSYDHVVQHRRFETFPQGGVGVPGQNAQHVEGTQADRIDQSGPCSNYCITNSLET